MKGELNFRCRHCGATVDMKVGDLRQQLAISKTAENTPTHNCDSTHIGVLELLGGTITEGGIPG